MRALFFITAAISLSALLLVGCQTQPTRQSHDNDLDRLKVKLVLSTWHLDASQPQRVCPGGDHCRCDQSAEVPSTKLHC